MVTPASAVTVVEKPKEKWDCVDFSTDFAQKNPDWGIVTISQQARFYGQSHMVNYQLNDDGSLNIHDGLYNNDYVFYNWQVDGYYHFWLNEKPVRYYKFLYDNSEIIQ
jgi:hypothetical protein